MIMIMIISIIIVIIIVMIIIIIIIVIIIISLMLLLCCSRHWSCMHKRIPVAACLLFPDHHAVNAAALCHVESDEIVAAAC